MVKINKKAAVTRGGEQDTRSVPFLLKSKKGMEMSLNLIIMLIIGMVILGLVIGFVNKLVGDGTKRFDQQLSDNDNYILEQLKSCSDHLCVNPYPSMTVVKGSETPIFIKVRATDAEIQATHCGPGIDLNSATTGVCPQVQMVITNGATPLADVTVKGPGLDTPINTEKAARYILAIPASTAKGTYYGTITLFEDDGATIVDKKTITIKVE